MGAPSSPLASTSRVTSAISRTLCRSKPTSYGVNIRGAGEVPSLRLSKAIEGVAEVIPPPCFEVRPMPFLEFTYLLPVRAQLGRVGFAGQRNGTDYLAAPVLDPASQIGQCTALADEVVNHHVFAVPIDVTTKSGLASEASVPIRTRVANDIGLHDGCREGDCKTLAQEFRQGRRNGVDASVLVRACADQYRRTTLGNLRDSACAPHRCPCR